MFLFRLLSSKMGNKSSTTALNDTHRKCVKTFCGTASEDVDRFVCQLEAVKHVYNLSDQLLLELTLEKIDGQALEWLHSKPGLMTLGIDHFKSELVKEFGKVRKVEEETVIPNPPSAPPKVDVCLAETRNDTRAYPDITDIELRLNNLKLEQAPPSYDIVFARTEVPRQQKPVPQTKETPKTPEKGPDKEKPVTKSRLLKRRVKKESRSRQSNEPNVSEEAGVSEIQPKASHKQPEPEKETPVQEPIKPALKCHYCKGESHLIRDCKKVPRCYNCGDIRHKKHNCPLLTESEVEEKALEEQNKEGTKPLRSFVRPKPRCYGCNSETHKLHACPFPKPPE